MNKKLTLSVEDSVISKAKEYAEMHNESLSRNEYAASAELFSRIEEKNI